MQLSDIVAASDKIHVIELGTRGLVFTLLLPSVQWDVPKVAGKSRDLQGKHVGSLGGGAIGSLVTERLKVTLRATAPALVHHCMGGRAPGALPGSCCTACGHARRNEICASSCRWRGGRPIVGSLPYCNHTAVRHTGSCLNRRESLKPAADHVKASLLTAPQKFLVLRPRSRLASPAATWTGRRAPRWRSWASTWSRSWTTSCPSATW